MLIIKFCLLKNIYIRKDLKPKKAECQKIQIFTKRRSFLAIRRILKNQKGFERGMNMFRDHVSYFCFFFKYNYLNIKVEGMR